MANAIGILALNDENGFAQILAIYREAIEPSEQKPPGVLAANFRDPRYAFLVSREESGIDAFASLFFAPGGQFWLLEYMAVDHRVRSKGNGERMFRSAVALAERRAPERPGLIEVDRPGHAERSGNDPQRRLAFYRRMGCRAISGLDYILPLETAGTPPPMMLLIHGLDEGTTLPRQQVQGWLEIIYRDVYGCEPNDPRIDTMTRRLDEHVRLFPLPVESERLG